MRVLGIETSGDWGGVALWDELGLMAAATFRHERQLSRLLSSRIERTLADAGWEPKSLEGIAVSLGPGSFTGLRIGVSEAKTLAYALDIPVIGIGTLEALAADHSFGGTVITLIAASATECFGSVSGPSPLDERLETNEFWEDQIARSPGALVVGVLGRHRDRLVGSETIPRAEAIARLGRERLLRGERDSTHALVPRYLRLSTPEVRKQEAAQQASP